MKIHSFFLFLTFTSITYLNAQNGIPENDSDRCSFSIGDYQLYQNGETLGDADVISLECKSEFDIEIPFSTSNDCKFESNCGFKLEVIDEAGTVLYSDLNIGPSFAQPNSSIKLSLANANAVDGKINLKFIVTLGCTVPLTNLFVPHSMSGIEVGSITLGTTDAMLSYDYTVLETTNEVKNGESHIFTDMAEDFLVCCNDLDQIKYVFEVAISHQVTQSSSNTLSVTSAFTIGTSLGTFNVGLSATSVNSTSETISSTLENKLKAVHTFDPPNGNNGNCVIPQFVERLRKYKIRKYKINCEGQPVEVGQPEEVWFLWKVILLSDGYVVSSTNDCEDIPVPTIHDGKNRGENTMKGCNYWISLEFPGISPNENGLKISWSGPNDYVGDGAYIENLELGEYTYTITNQCCESISGTVNVCDGELIYTDWEPNKVTGEYCRTITCKENPGLENISVVECETNECITPEIKVEVIDGRCIERYYYQEELLGESIIGESSILRRYNQSEDLCVEEVYCGETIVEERSELPIYGDWNYDNFSEKCTREIICFNETLSHETENAEIKYTYDELIGQCSKTAVCDGFEIELPPTIPVYGVWSYNFIEEKCAREVYCNGVDITNTQLAEPDIEESYNSLTGLCDRTANCGFVPTALSPVFPISSSIWSWSSIEGCTKDIQCSVTGNVFTYQGVENIEWVDYNGISCIGEISCDDTEVFGQQTYQFPNFIGQWTIISNFSNDCSRDITCDINGDIVTQVIPSDIEIDFSSPCDDNPNLHAYWVTCNNERIEYVDCNGNRSSADDSLERKKIDSNKDFEKYTVFPNPFDAYLEIGNLKPKQTYVAIISDSYGRILSRMEIEENSVLQTIMLPDGVYTLTVFSDNKFLFTKTIMKL